jgi:hypothetical protein
MSFDLVVLCYIFDSFLVSIILMLCFAHECVHGKYCVVLFCGVCVFRIVLNLQLVKIIVGKHFLVYFLDAKKTHPLKLEFLTSNLFKFFFGSWTQIGCGCPRV